MICLNHFSIGVSPSAKEDENEVGEIEIQENVEGNFVTFSYQPSTFSHQTSTSSNRLRLIY